MKLYRGLQHFKKLNHAVVTQGTFDGVHFGHQQILQEVVKEAKAKNTESVLVTFFPHPRLVLYPDDNSLKLITGVEEKARLIESCGIDHMIVLPFTKEFSKLSALEFIRDVLVEGIGMKYFIIGYDHRFGKNREGNIDDVRELSTVFDYDVQEIPAQDINDSVISSTKIRNALLNGQIEIANKYLGHTFTLWGRVVNGRKEGRKLGYPTANIKVEDPFKLIPGNGIYIAQAKVHGKVYNGMMSIGNNPTFGNASWSVEVHLFDFDKDIYEEVVEIRMLKRIRDEIKFAKIEFLIAQLANDEEISKAYFSNLNKMNSV
jgi:riboflavin kinase/FMN adenylyltransferase